MWASDRKRSSRLLIKYAVTHTIHASRFQRSIFSSSNAFEEPQSQWVLPMLRLLITVVLGFYRKATGAQIEKARPYSFTIQSELHY